MIRSAKLTRLESVQKAIVFLRRWFFFRRNSLSLKFPKMLERANDNAEETDEDLAEEKGT